MTFDPKRNKVANAALCDVMTVTVDFVREATVECKVHNDGVRRESEFEVKGDSCSRNALCQRHPDKFADTAHYDGMSHL